MHALRTNGNNLIFNFYKIQNTQFGNGNIFSTDFFTNREYKYITYFYALTYTSVADDAITQLTAASTVAVTRTKDATLDAESFSVQLQFRTTRTEGKFSF